MTLESFRAFRAVTIGDAVERSVGTMSVDELPADGVLVDVHWSSVNYKDGLASTPSGSPFGDGFCPRHGHFAPKVLQARCQRAASTAR